MNLARTVLISTMAIAMAGCATSATVANKTGTTRTFDAPYNQTKLAARHSVETLNVKVTKVDDFGQSYTVWFNKPVSAWSWGEQGQVVVRPSGPQTSVVEVRAEKRNRMQVTGTDQEEFASAIFDGIDKGLQDLRK